jgi:hypothetical protein
MLSKTTDYNYIKMTKEEMEKDSDILYIKIALNKAIPDEKLF